MIRTVTAIFFVALAAAGCSDATDMSQATDEGWGSTPYASGKGDIYGQDSRFEIQDPNVDPVYQRVADSTAVVFSTFNIQDTTSSTIRLNAQSMSNRTERELGAPLCSSERFRDDAAPGYCTAFLIAPDLVATAGHCVNGHTTCGKMGFAFGFAKSSPGDTGLSLSRDDFYRCEQIVGHEFNQGEQSTAELASGELWQDWAVVKLDRPVRGRTPLEINLNAPTSGDRITAVGHPAGLAMKATMGRVVGAAKSSYFNTDLDIYRGNSGSPAVDTSGRVRGIVIRGSGGKSFSKTQDGCYTSNRCDAVGASGCIGNHVLLANPLAPFLARDLSLAVNFTTANGDVTPTWQDTLDIGEDGTIAFVTANINGFSMDPSKLRFELGRVGGTSTVLMEGAKKLSKGETRYTRTTHAFDGQNARGSWRIKISDTAETRTQIGWWQVIVGISDAPGAPTRTVTAWIGTTCEADADCGFDASGSPGFCYVEGGSQGFCTVPCQGFCPDKSGHAATFCIDSDSPQTGVCASVPDTVNQFCDAIPGTFAQEESRFIGTSSAPAATREACSF